jgi:hypothetical protein
MTWTNAWGLLVAAGLLMTAPAWGQNAEQLAKVPPKVRAEIQTKFMAEKMQLTPEERTKVEAINQKYADQMQPVLEGQMGPLERMRAVKKLEEAKDGELKAVLTPAQFQTYEASKDEMKKRLEQRALNNG